jgi:phage shock protein PspC (stress-responsive transcriptional regulator)
MTDLRKLTRSESDRMIAGVCGGIAEFFGVDVTLVRIGFVLLSVFGAGLALYVVLWLIVPRASMAGADARDVVRDGVAEGRRLAEDAAKAAREAVQGPRNAA